jgi:hypothetical protein
MGASRRLLVPAAQGQHGLVQRVLDRLPSAGGDLGGELGAGQQRLSPLNGPPFRLSHGRPRRQADAVARRGGCSRQPG